MHRRLPCLLALCLLGFTSACSSGTSDPTDRIEVSIQPASVVLTTGDARAFQATALQSSQGVAWSVQEGGTGGTVTASGLYTAPATAGSFHVVATAVENPRKRAIADVKVVPPPTIDRFTASQTLVPPGTSVVLQPVFSAGTGSLDQGLGPVTSAQQVTVKPPQTTTYTLSVTNEAGREVRASVTVSVLVQPRIDRFDFSPGAIAPGGSAGLMAVFSGGTGQVMPDVGLVTSGQVVQVAPAATTTYTLTVTSDLGQTASASARLVVLPPLAIAAFTASTLSAYPLDAVDLAFAFTGGTGLLLPDRIPVTSGVGLTVHPRQTTDYTLQVTDPSGRQVQTTLSVLIRAKGAFVLAGSMGTPRRDHTATILADGSVLVAGGVPLESGGPALDLAERYDPAQDRFAPVGAMTARRTRHAATRLLDGRVLLCGGNATWTGEEATPQDTVASVEIFDPASGAFTGAGSLLGPRRDHQASLLADGTVLVTGGNPGSGPQLATAEIYDPVSGTSRPVAPPMAAARQDHLALPLASGKVLLAGGLVRLGATPLLGLGSAETFTVGPPSRWDATATSLTTGRGRACAVTLADGRILVAGGLGPASTWLASTEYYDPARQAFDPGIPLLSALISPSASRLGDGRVLVAGDGLAEVLDPATGISAPVQGPVMPTGQGRTASPLPDGSALVVGLAGAHRFDPKAQ
jgi:hypothetical protein